MSLQYAISVATTFEMGEFQGSPDQVCFLDVARTAALMVLLGNV